MKEIKAKAAKTVIKEIRFGPNTDDHDFEFKLKHAMNLVMLRVGYYSDVWLAIVCFCSGCKKDDVSRPWILEDPVSFNEARECARRANVGWKHQAGPLRTDVDKGSVPGGSRFSNRRAEDIG